jgi:TRAP transporter TAXI family solute receptor
MKKLCPIFLVFIAASFLLGVSELSVPAQAGAITKINIGGGRVGDPWYILSEALANFINKKSDWLRATVVATPGLTGVYELARKNPEVYMGVVDPCNFVHMQRDPYGKAHNYYNKMRFISVGASMTWLWVTYDKNIKTPKDFIGKKVNVGRKAAARTPDEVAVLKAWGILDKVKLVQSGYGGAKRNLKDGLVDIACIIFDHIYPTTFAKGAFITDLETKGPIYYIGMDSDMIDKIRVEGPGGIIAARVPAKSLDPQTQPKDLWAGGFPTFFGADERMDPKIVAEVTRVIYESAGEFAKWHPQGRHLTKDFIPSVLDVKYIHPGAKKYFDANGIKIKNLSDMLR